MGKYTLAILLIILFLCGGVVGWTVHDYSSSGYWKRSCQDILAVNDYSQYIGTPIPTIEDIISQIAQNVSDSHKYIRDKYDCTQFSQELVKRLQAINLTAYCVGTAMYHWEDENKTKFDRYLLHTWVEVSYNGTIIPIEATQGYIIDNETYYKDYKITERGMCW